MPFERVAILGLGLMGGSLARALARLPDAPRVVGWGPDPEEVDDALDAGAISWSASSRAGAVATAELVVLAAPLGATVESIAELASEMSSDATLTDLASLKAPILAAVRDAGLDDRWVGSHPMAGSERSGFHASRTDLYDEATVWTVAAPVAEARREALHELWSAIGARPRPIGAEDHDRLMALVSHVPQLTASALASVLEARGVEPEQLGPGGQGMTRLASSSVAMWADLIEHAPIELADSLRALADTLAAMADRLESRDAEAVAETMRRAARWKGG